MTSRFRSFVFCVGAAGVIAGSVPLVAAEKPAVPVVAAPQEPLPADATHEQFVTWVRKTDLGRMIQRDPASLMRVKGRLGFAVVMNESYRSVLVVRAAAGEAPVVACVSSEADAEKMIAPQIREAQKP